MNDAEVKMNMAILIALEAASESIRRAVYSDVKHIAPAQAALEELRKPEHVAALQAMQRGAIAGAATAFGVGSDVEPSPQRPLPDGWPEGWSLGTVGGVVRRRQYRSVRDGDKPTAILYETQEDARRDAWERYWSEHG